MSRIQQNALYGRRMLLMLLLAVCVSPSFAVQSITGISHQVTPEGVVRIEIKAAEPFETLPASFATDSPSRVVVDIAGGSGLDSGTYAVNQQGVGTLRVVESADRVRLVAQLEEKLPYEISFDENTLIMEIGNPLSAASGTATVQTEEAADQQTAEGAQAEPSTETLSGSSGRLSLNFQDIEIRSVLQLLADFTGLNMVVSDTVGGNITLRLKDVRWQEALDIILQTKGLTMRQKGNIMMVAPTAEVTARERLEAESKISLEQLAPLQTKIIKVKYGKAQDMAELMKTEANLFLSERGSIGVDMRTNALLIHDIPSSIKKIAGLIAKLDHPVRQVMIDSRVVIATDDFARDIGIRFGGAGIQQNGDTIFGASGSKSALILGDPTGGLAPDTLAVNLPATLGGPAGGAVNFFVGKLGSYLMQLEISAMQQEGTAEVVASPRVVTTDQHPALIEQGTEIPYSTSNTFGGTNTEFKKAVLKLEVTPHITPDDNIIMDLVINKDRPILERLTLGEPPIETKKVESTVLVKNGETIVLGGIFEEEKSKGTDSIPYLGKIPGLGRLFRRERADTLKRELLIFVTPKILRRTEGRSY
ncbi:MAG: type IV pilus secretin PilQ family protein [Pseudomonadota bacterium]